VLDTNITGHIRVLIADDQKLFAESLQYVIEARADDIEVLAIAENGLQAIEKSQQMKPDIILMDVRMPELDGVQATRKILQLSPGIRIVMLSTFQDDDDVRSAIRYGAVGYLVKNLSPEEVIRAIRAVHAGTVQISPSVAQALMKGNGEPSTDIEDELYMEPLTNREKEVLVLIMNAYENKQIASYLNVQEQTAKNYVHNLYAKLGVSSRMQLLQFLKRPGVINRLDIKDYDGN
jgi:DNA-binding NarL/FixJ family response regulator